MSRITADMTSPGLEITLARQSAPSVSGESTHSMASTTLVAKDLAGMPIAHKVGHRQFVFNDWKGNEITREEALRIAGGYIWYQNEADPTEGCVRRRDGRYGREDDARSHLSASRVGCSSDIANLADFEGENRLQDVLEEEEEKEPCREEEPCQGSGNKEAPQTPRSFPTLWCILILCVVFAAPLSLHCTSRSASGVAFAPPLDLKLSAQFEQGGSRGCTTGSSDCIKDFKQRTSMHPTGNTEMSWPLSDLLAKDEMYTDGDVVHLLSGPLHEKDIDDHALPIAKLKVMAKAEIDRILACRDVSDILGHGGKKEFHRIAHLLHPDKGLVSRDDPRANLALRLVFAAHRATSQSE